MLLALTSFVISGRFSKKWGQYWQHPLTDSYAILGLSQILKLEVDIDTKEHQLLTIQSSPLSLQDCVGQFWEPELANPTRNFFLWCLHTLRRACKRLCKEKVVSELNCIFFVQFSHLYFVEMSCLDADLGPQEPVPPFLFVSPR